MAITYLQFFSQEPLLVLSSPNCVRAHVPFLWPAYSRVLKWIAGFDESPFTTFILFFLKYHFSEREEMLRAEWINIFDRFWVVFCSILYKMIMFPRSAPSDILS